MASQFEKIVPAFYGPNPATDNAITRYDGISGKKVQNSLATLQDAGDIRSQAFAFKREIINDVTIPDGFTVIAQDILMTTGNITIEGDGEIVLV